MKHLTTAFLILVFSTYAVACSCLYLIGTLGATMAFSGTVEKMELIEEGNWSGYFEVTFSVDTVAKGAVTDRMKVYTASNEGACGFSFRKGSTYVVYAVGDNPDSLEVHLCSYTHEVEGTVEFVDGETSARH